MQAFATMNGVKPMTIKNSSVNTNVTSRQSVVMKAAGSMRGPSQYAMMSGSISAKQFAAPSMRSQGVAVNAPKSFFGQAPNAMKALGGKSVAAQAMHQKYSAASRADRIPTMMMG